MTKKHKVKIEISTLQETPLYPPRKRLWDLLPEWLCLQLIKRGIWNPPATPFEVWALNSVYLRAHYVRLLGLSAALNQQSLQASPKDSDATSTSDPYRWS